ncbi:MAG: hypothetical protein HND48_22630 [Chloroflexi bacterium]|nr:hypothetical protein [Chloroflexota bacterium]
MTAPRAVNDQRTRCTVIYRVLRRSGRGSQPALARPGAAARAIRSRVRR